MSTAPLVRLESVRSSSAEEKGAKYKIRLQRPPEPWPAGAADEEEEALAPPPAREDPNDTISFTMPFFSLGSAEDFLRWRQRWEELVAAKNWANDAHALFQNVSFLLKDDACFKWDSVLRPVPRTVEAFEEAMRRFEGLMLPSRRAAANQKEYLRTRIDRKPANMTIREFIVRWRMLNGYLRFMPGREDERTPLTDADLQEVILRVVSLQWRLRFFETYVDQDQADLADMETYFTLLEEHQMTRDRRAHPPANRPRSPSRDGRGDNRNRPQGQRQGFERRENRRDERHDRRGNDRPRFNDRPRNDNRPVERNDRDQNRYHENRYVEGRRPTYDQPRNYQGNRHDRDQGPPRRDFNNRGYGNGNRYRNQNQPRRRWEQQNHLDDDENPNDDKVNEQVEEPEKEELENEENSVRSKSEPKENADHEQDKVYAIEECYANLDDQENQNPNAGEEQDSPNHWTRNIPDDIANWYDEVPVEPPILSPERLQQLTRVAYSLPEELFGDFTAEQRRQLFTHTVNVV
jgi:hypothetical protein